MREAERRVSGVQPQRGLGQSLSPTMNREVCISRMRLTACSQVCRRLKESAKRRGSLKG